MYVYYMNYPVYCITPKKEQQQFLKGLLGALKHRGDALEFCSEEQRDDKEICLQAG